MILTEHGRDADDGYLPDARLEAGRQLWEKHHGGGTPPEPEPEPEPVQPTPAARTGVAAGRALWEAHHGADRARPEPSEAFRNGQTMYFAERPAAARRHDARRR